MMKLHTIFFVSLFAMLFTSCQAIGDIFSAGVWVGIVIVIVIIAILVPVFGREK